ncbi:MAG: hypothetical protein AAGK04_13720 [Planctomycetota bacterium]
MNWFVFALFAWLAIGLEVGLKDVLQIGPGSVAPSFVLPLAVFVAMWAPSSVALWASFALGVLVDLTWQVPRTDAGVATILGPYALGFTLAGWLVINMRGMVIRRNPATMAFLCLLASAVAQTVVVALYTIRSLYGDPVAWSPASELLSRVFAGSLYTALMGLLLSLGLFAATPIFQFQQNVKRPIIKR